MQTKKLSFVRKGRQKHWVGDGFHVRNIFSYNDIAEEMSPFLLMDFAGPDRFPATDKKLGVGQHPHRGFETVTIVYEGEVEHRDSAGGGGKIGPGDVQWMTAASGIVHEEYHGTEFARRGGAFEMIQLWVNLAKKDKMAPPGYQGITNEAIPRIELDGDAGIARVIAGRLGGVSGPARTFSPLNLWDIRLRAGSHTKLEVTDGWTTALFVLKGKLKLSGGEIVDEASLAVMERAGTQLSWEALEETTLLFLNGQPLKEPIVGYGPFVMTSEEEIRQAFADFRDGRMGQITKPSTAPRS